MLVVDDHPGFRAVARALLEAGGLQVIGEVADGATALAMCADRSPDLVLLDIQLPDIDGFEVRRRLLRHDHPPLVLLTSTRSAAAYGRRLLDPDQVPFVPKDELSIDSIIGLFDAH